MIHLRTSLPNPQIRPISSRLIVDVVEREALRAARWIPMWSKTETKASLRMCTAGWNYMIFYVFLTLSQHRITSWKNEETHKNWLFYPSLLLRYTQWGWNMQRYMFEHVVYVERTVRDIVISLHTHTVSDFLQFHNLFDSFQMKKVLPRLFWRISFSHSPFNFHIQWKLFIQVFSILVYTTLSYYAWHYCCNCSISFRDTQRRCTYAWSAHEPFSADPIQTGIIWCLWEIHCSVSVSSAF